MKEILRQNGIWAMAWLLFIVLIQEGKKVKQKDIKIMYFNEEKNLSKFNFIDKAGVQVALTVRD